MASTVIGCLLFIVIASFAKAWDTHQLNITYSSGFIFELTASDQSLPEIPIVQICHRGMWVGYGKPNFAGYASELFVEPSFEWRCKDYEDENLASVKAVGVKKEFSMPFAEVYFGESFIRAPDPTWIQERNIPEPIVIESGGIFELHNPIVSVMAINTDLEFFNQTNFQGDSFCYRESGSYCSPERNEACWNWRADDLNKAPWKLSLAKSVTLGCRHGTRHVKRVPNPWSYLIKD